MSSKMRRYVFVALVVSAQQTGQNTPPGRNAPATFTTSTQLVVETVAVTDKKGNPIEGLTAKDFTVTENGAPQTIRFCEFQRVQDSPDISKVESVTRNQILPETPGDIRYKNRRLLALYFDMTAMPVPDQLRALTAARKFIRTQMAPVDLMAIMKFSTGSVQGTISE